MDELNFYCPFCGEQNETSVYPEDGSKQTFTLDCEVCCRPVILTVVFSGDEIVSVSVEKEYD